MSYILAIDQGTSSTRAALVDKVGKIISMVQKPIHQLYPKEGWVEHSPEDIWQQTLSAMKEVVVKAHIQVKDIIACGIANQRESTVLWHKKTGEVLGNVVVWSDRRSARQCEAMKSEEKTVKEKTGLLIDPYFSANKIKWVLQQNPDAMALAKSGDLAFGTIDSFLIWRLTEGQAHYTDITNASRTLLFNIHDLEWDSDLCELFGVPMSMLPVVKPCNGQYGEMDKRYLGLPIPIMGVAGDQQASLIGQACFKPGMLKTTYGTGAFLMLNTGQHCKPSDHGLLSTIAYQIDDEVAYGLEGSIFNTGTVVKWLRDSLGLITDVNETEQLASDIPDNGGVYMVPGFTGLGAPYWAPHVKATFLGMKLDTDKRHLVRAALESVAFQTHDLISIMRQEVGEGPSEMRVDGGMVVNNWLLQQIANTCQLRIRRPACIETTVRGAAFLAGLGASFYASLNELTDCWHEDRSFLPEDIQTTAQCDYHRWQKAVESTCLF